jgi:hypothetical protein
MILSFIKYFTRNEQTDIWENKQEVTASKER